MKTLTLALALGLGMPLAAYASDGTISISGQISNNTCQINGNTAGSPTVVSVVLPLVSRTALATAGQTAAPTPFNLNLTNCTGSTAQTLFEIGPTVNQTTGNLMNQAVGGAVNVEVGLLNNSFQAINVGSNANSQTVAITSSAATLRYYAQYVATGVAGAGSVATSVQFSMLYN
jgi:major type 1 subunit fimbrin (pilin)